MLQGQGFGIVNDNRIKNTDALSAETRATILDKLTENQQIMCRMCLIRLDKTYAKLEISGEFGQWLTANGSNEIHVRVPLNVFYDLEDENPLDAMQPQKSNVAMSIREELKFQIEEIVKASPDAASCTDINRLLLMVEEMEITYFHFIPMVLDRNSNLTQIFKEHAMYTQQLSSYDLRLDQSASISNLSISFKLTRRTS